MRNCCWQVADNGWQRLHPGQNVAAEAQTSMRLPCVNRVAGAWPASHGPRTNSPSASASPNQPPVSQAQVHYDHSTSIKPSTMSAKISDSACSPHQWSSCCSAGRLAAAAMPRVTEPGVGQARLACSCRSCATSTAFSKRQQPRCGERICACASDPRLPGDSDLASWDGVAASSTGVAAWDVASLGVWHGEEQRVEPPEELDRAQCASEDFWIGVWRPPSRERMDEQAK